MSPTSNAGANALILGWLAYIGLMTVHPAHAGGPSLGHVDLNDAVHWIALLIAPFLAYGSFEMSRHLGWDRPLPVTAFCVTAFGLLVGMNAGVMSGLVQPEVARAMAQGESAPEILTALRHMTYWLNQGFAAIHYTLLALGVGLYGLAWRTRPKARVLGTVGALIGAAFLVWLTTGLWRPDLHGSLFAVLAVGAWTIAAGLKMHKPSSQISDY